MPFLTTHLLHLPAFDGPLDLLLQLVEREELDITSISLAQVTDNYLTAIEEMGRQGMGDLSAFLVIAARLVWIKSRVLLPGQPPSRQEVEEVAADLVEQLETYRQFKMVAQELARFEESGRCAYVRLVPAGTQPVQADLDGVTLQGLLAAAQQALEALAAPPVEEVISPLVVTVADQITYIEQRLAREGRVSFEDLLSGAVGRLEVIVTFLAVLELLKQDRVRVWQEGLFGPILLEASVPNGAAAPGPLSTQANAVGDGLAGGGSVGGYGRLTHRSR